MNKDMAAIAKTTITDTINPTVFMNSCLISWLYAVKTTSMIDIRRSTETARKESKFAAMLQTRTSE